jgi:hypothetical protein
MENLRNKPVRPLIKSMDKDDVEIYHISRADVVRATVHRLQIQLLGKWITKTEGDTIIVTRTA